MPKDQHHEDIDAMGSSKETAIDVSGMNPLTLFELEHVTGEENDVVVVDTPEESRQRLLRLLRTSGDFDGDDYDALLQLDEIIGSAKPSSKGVPAPITAAAAAGTEGTCPICLEEFVAGAMLKTLPVCRHLFHAACIDKWFEMSPHSPN